MSGLSRSRTAGRRSKAISRRAEELGLADRVLQIPFLPHWRVPEFLRGCLAVCCLEQDFPIDFTPRSSPREVLLCGTCLVGSTEVFRKLPDHERLPDGYGCVAIEDVQDIEALSARLAAIVRDPAPVASVAVRGRAFAREAQGDDACPRGSRSAQVGGSQARSRKKRAPGRATSARIRASDHPDGGTRAAGDGEPAVPARPNRRRRRSICQHARDVLAAAERGHSAGEFEPRPVAAAIRLEIAIAEVENAAGAGGGLTENLDPYFRLRTKRWALVDDDLGDLVPVRIRSFE